MGAQVGTGGGFRNEPNVIPMIDILLVLLIIFMMQIPLQRKKMDVQLPPVQEADQPQQKNPQQTDQIVLELAQDGSYQINSEAVPKEMLERRLREIYDPRPVKLMFIKTARNRRYEEVIEAMDIARSAGVQVIGFTPPDAG
jgi:biopolymer transport protein ExbD